jgi:hypothetical protein
VETTVYNKILNLTGFEALPDLDLAIGPCVGVSNATAFDFQFRGHQGTNATQAPLRVLLSQMLLPVFAKTGPVYGEFSVYWPDHGALSWSIFLSQANLLTIRSIWQSVLCSRDRPVSDQQWQYLGRYHNACWVLRVRPRQRPSFCWSS